MQVAQVERLGGCSTGKSAPDIASATFEGKLAQRPRRNRAGDRLKLMRSKESLRGNCHDRAYRPGRDRRAPRHLPGGRLNRSRHRHRHLREHRRGRHRLRGELRRLRLVGQGRRSEPAHADQRRSRRAADVAGGRRLPRCADHRHRAQHLRRAEPGGRRRSLRVRRSLPGHRSALQSTAGSTPSTRTRPPSSWRCGSAPSTPSAGPRTPGTRRTSRSLRRARSPCS